MPPTGGATECSFVANHGVPDRQAHRVPARGGQAQRVAPGRYRSIGRPSLIEYPPVAGRLKERHARLIERSVGSADGPRLKEWHRYSLGVHRSDQARARPLRLSIFCLYIHIYRYLITYAGRRSTGRTQICVSEGKSQKLKLCVCPNATRPDRQLATVTRPVGEKAKPRRISACGLPLLLARGTLLAHTHPPHHWMPFSVGNSTAFYVSSNSGLV